MAQTSERHHHESQLGSTAVAPPLGTNDLPSAAPALHHLGDDHTSDSQIGPSAIAPPKGDAAHPDQLPEQHHLEDDQSPADHAPVKPFVNRTEPSKQPPPPSRPDPSNTKHTSASQLGPSAIAAPSGIGIASHPPPAPALHHIKDDHTFETQLGKPAIAPPAELLTNPWQEDEDEEEDPATTLTFPDLPLPPKPERAKVWTASKDLGFFYLDLRAATSPDRTIDGPGLQTDIQALFALGQNLFSLPTPEKQTYDFAPQGSYFGYKGIGAGVVDASGTRDRNEFYNVSKDDMLGLSPPLPAPEVLKKQISRDLLAGFVRKSHAIATLLLGVLNDKLGLPEGKLQSLHRLEELSGDQVRWVRSRPQPVDDRQKALGEHTGEYGQKEKKKEKKKTSQTKQTTPNILTVQSQTSAPLTLLTNRLGGLQILPPSTPTTPNPTWEYIRPLPAHLIINLGDALVRFTAGVLRSNLHRVVDAPGAQAGSERMSLVYFARPEDDVVLRVVEGSEVVEGGESEEEEGEGRALGRRVGGDWAGSEGTEGGGGELEIDDGGGWEMRSRVYKGSKAASWVPDWRFTPAEWSWLNLLRQPDFAPDSKGQGSLREYRAKLPAQTDEHHSHLPLWACLIGRISKDSCPTQGEAIRLGGNYLHERHIHSEDTQISGRVLGSVVAHCSGRDMESIFMGLQLALRRLRLDACEWKEEGYVEVIIQHRHTKQTMGAVFVSTAQAGKVFRRLRRRIALPWCSSSLGAAFVQCAYDGNIYLDMPTAKPSRAGRKVDLDALTLENLPKSWVVPKRARVGDMILAADRAAAPILVRPRDTGGTFEFIGAAMPCQLKMTDAVPAEAVIGFNKILVKRLKAAAVDRYVLD
ncbi:hypothetical protein Q7P37_002096 [Cladosporium fusiforme]